VGHGDRRGASAASFASNSTPLTKLWSIFRTSIGEPLQVRERRVARCRSRRARAGRRAPFSSVSFARLPLRTRSMATALRDLEEGSRGRRDRVSSRTVRIHCREAGVLELPARRRLNGEFGSSGKPQSCHSRKLRCNDPSGAPHIADTMTMRPVSSRIEMNLPGETMAMSAKRRPPEERLARRTFPVRSEINWAGIAAGTPSASRADRAEAHLQLHSARGRGPFMSGRRACKVPPYAAFTRFIASVGRP